MKSDRNWMTYLMYHEPMTKKTRQPKLFGQPAEP
jgi:hypothetical protein